MTTKSRRTTTDLRTKKADHVIILYPGDNERYTVYSQSTKIPNDVAEWLLNSYPSDVMRVVKEPKAKVAVEPTEEESNAESQDDSSPEESPPSEEEGEPDDDSNPAEDPAEEAGA